MIRWIDEELAGEAVYNIFAEGGDFFWVSFRLDNEVLAAGTAFSAKNMERLLQKGLGVRRFYYNGEDVASVNFGPAEDGVREGVLLAKCYGGAVFSGDGVFYLVCGGEVERVVNPRDFEVLRECEVFCGVGRETFGVVQM